MGLKEILSEYFLGTETIKEFEKERSFYREFSCRPSDSRGKAFADVTMSHIREVAYLAVGKWMPGICEALSIMNYARSNNPNFLYVGITASEMCRAVTALCLINPHFEGVKEIQKLEKKASYLEHIIEKGREQEGRL